MYSAVKSALLEIKGHLILKGLLNVFLQLKSLDYNISSTGLPLLLVRPSHDYLISTRLLRLEGYEWIDHAHENWDQELTWQAGKDASCSARHWCWVHFSIAYCCQCLYLHPNYWQVVLHVVVPLIRKCYFPVGSIKGYRLECKINIIWLLQRHDEPIIW